MRLLRVYIDGYRNLKNVTVDFDKDSLTTVVIGENGSGKSNLIEAIVEIFRAWDLRRPNELKFSYRIEYAIAADFVTLNSPGMMSSLNPHYMQLGSHFIPDQPWATCQSISQIGNLDTQRSTIGEVPVEFLPDLVFGYYSGSGQRLERLFDRHQTRYYDVINKERPRIEYQIAREQRRLFYCRPSHGSLALLAYLAKPHGDDGPGELLTERLGITGFHSALALLKQPSWYKGSQIAAFRETGSLWGAHGPAGDCARALRDTAFHAIELEGTAVDDYRRGASKEAQLACFLRDEKSLRKFAANYKSDREMFAALEAADISDLFRDMTVWVARTNDASGDISFSDLSDGERQLLMVLGLIRVSRGREALFLLDEPDTHLNPAWQLTYLDLIREWTEVAADEDKCQIIMTTHNPLTIAALEAKEVRVMSADDDGNISVAQPRIDPKGLGFAGVLTDIFGLSSSLDKPTQEKIDRRNELARETVLDPAMAKEFADIKEELRHLGFLYEERDKLYSEFLRQLDNVELADVDPLTPDELLAREAESREIVERLLKKP
ncbi:MAG: AAA family ATPase [Erythrobacter sp.]|nr:AAA family ATPase [Erythrobacter sp.]